MRATWGDISARERQLATNFDEPVMAELYCHIRIELSKAGPSKKQAEESIRYGVQELSLNKEGSSFRVQWNPAGGFVNSTIEIAFKYAVQTLAEFHKLTAETKIICQQVIQGSALKYSSQRKDASLCFFGRLFYTTILLQLLQTQITKDSISPPKPRSARDSRKLAACAARNRSEQCAKRLLAHWAHVCLGTALTGSAGTLARTGRPEHLLKKGWSLNVKNTFYEVSETKQRHSCGYGTS
jgi:hypothetical protein